MVALPTKELDWLREYIKQSRWKTAKDNKHAYTVREWRPDADADFVRFVEAVRAYGHPENFFRKIYIYLVVDDMKYWTMGSPMHETIIINRAPKDQFFGRQTVPQPKPSELPYDTLAPKYDRRYNTPECEQEDDYVFGLLELFSKGKTLLDVGCGTGLAVERLKPSVYDYYGIDPSQGMMNEFIRKFPEYPFEQITFDDFCAKSRYEFDLTISLYGSPSYIDPFFYDQLRRSGKGHFLMFYREGYLPDYHADNSLNKTDYDQMRETFIGSTFYTFNNFIVVTNLPIEV